MSVLVSCNSLHVLKNCINSVENPAVCILAVPFLLYVRNYNYCRQCSSVTLNDTSETIYTGLCPKTRLSDIDEMFRHVMNT